MINVEEINVFFVENDHQRDLQVNEVILYRIQVYAFVFSSENKKEKGTYIL
jgi:hypothetical protein